MVMLVALIVILTGPGAVAHGGYVTAEWREPASALTTKINVAERAAAFLRAQFGDAFLWARINDRLWHAVMSSPTKVLTVQNIVSISQTANVDVRDVLAVVGILSAPPEPFLTMRYFIRRNGEDLELSQRDVSERLYAWWRLREISDEDWKQWSDSITVEWRPTELPREIP
jgi:hypothetical protein